MNKPNIPEPVKASEPSRRLLSLQYLIDTIPDDWHGAALAIDSSMQGEYLAVRFSLHENITGRRIIVLSQEQLAPKLANSTKP